MNRSKKTAIIGLRSLETLGVRSVIHEISDVTIDSFTSFAEFRSVAENADAYIVSSDVFAEYIDYFMPRKGRTLIVSSAKVTENAGDVATLIFSNSDDTYIYEVIKKLISSLKDEDTVAGELSQREKEVLRLIASGKINKEIADELCISVNTVITHRKNISAKLGIKSASGLSLYAMMNGII